MTDTVLQSFCERCGTRYTYTDEERKPEGGLSVLGRLVKRGPDPAPGEPAVSTTLPSSDRFAGTFHFCLECRQYTCGDCWNSAAGSCIGCRPPGQATHRAEVARAATPSTGLASPPARPSRPATPPSPGARPSTGQAPAAGPSTSEGERSGAPTASPWGSGDSVAAAILRASVGSDAAKGSSSGREGAAQDDPRGSIESDADVVLDEWGRPVKRTARAGPGASTEDEPSGTTKPELDPWRGVVFSADEAEKLQNEDEARAERPTGGPAPTTPPRPPPSEWPASDRRRAPSPERGADAPAWPETDTRRRSSTQPAQATSPPGTPWPEEARTRGTDAPGEADSRADGVDRSEAAFGHVERPSEGLDGARAAAGAEAVAGSEPSSEPQGSIDEAAAETIEEPQAQAADASLRFVDPSEVEATARTTEEPGVAEADAATLPEADEEPGVAEADEEPGVAEAEPTTPEPTTREPTTPHLATPELEVPPARPEGDAETPEAAPALTPDQAAPEAEAREAVARVSENAAATPEPPTAPPAPEAPQGPPRVPEPSPGATAPMPPTAPSGVPSQPTRTAPATPPAAPGPPPLAPRPVPPPQPSGSEPTGGPFSLPFASSTPLQAPQQPSPGLPQPPPALAETAPTTMRQAPMPTQPPRPAPLPVPHPGLAAPVPVGASPTAAPSMAPLPTRGDRASTRACANCALPLSAKARFCRRCGAPQA